MTETEQMQELRSSASEYVKHKTELDALKKKCDSLNTNIKHLMEKLQMDSVDVGDVELRFSVQTRETLNEDLLLAALKRTAEDTKSIKTKEYVDMDTLESEIYNGLISDEALKAIGKCKEVKQVPRLDIKKSKK